MNYENEDTVLGAEDVIDGEFTQDRNASADQPTGLAENGTANASDEPQDPSEEALPTEGNPAEEQSDRTATDSGTDYTLEGDISTLLNEVPALRAALSGGINAARYEELRRMGLSAKEAYLAASSRTGQDNRSHMVTGVPGGASSPTGGMSCSEMELARGLFSGIPESEIKRLYAKVTK